MFNDSFILDRYVSQDIVFVIPAYRLGIFGLLYLGNDNLVPRNLALYDCKMALQYIHDEIFHFGGHPSDINLMGHSSGAHIALAFGFSRLIDPHKVLINKIIVISAVPIFNSPDLFIKNCYALAKGVGCYEEYSSTDEEVVKCLRKKHSRDLLFEQESLEDKHLYIWNFLRGPPFMNADESIADFEKNAVPREMMIGTTMEGNGYKRPKKANPFLAGSFMDLQNPEEVAHQFNQYYATDPLNTTNQLFAQATLVSTATYSKAMSDAGGKVYLFQSNQRPYSSHVSDMQYFIGTHQELVRTRDMDILDSFYSQLIVNFTKLGNPSHNWKPLNSSRMNYFALEVDTERGIRPKMEEDYQRDTVNFWYINLTEFDKEVTTQKSPVVVFSPSNESSEFDVSSKWWFYALIVVVALIIYLVIYFLKRAILKVAPSNEDIAFVMKI